MLLVKTIDRFLFGLRVARSLLRSLVACVPRQRTRAFPINFVAVCPRAIKIRELELRKLVRQCHRDVKTCFFFLLAAGEKSHGDSILDNRSLLAVTTLLERPRTDRDCARVCARALVRGSSRVTVLPVRVHTVQHRGIYTQTHDYTSTDSVQRHVRGGYTYASEAGILDPTGMQSWRPTRPQVPRSPSSSLVRPPGCLVSLSLFVFTRSNPRRATFVKQRLALVECTRLLALFRVFSSINATNITALFNADLYRARRKGEKKRKEK